MSDQQKVTYIGKVDFRNKELPFGIKERDRTKHTYVIGKSGMGKSTLLENLAIQDINNGEGLCVIDPHGSMAEKLLDHIPESRVKDVVYFSPADNDYPVGLNVLEKVPADKRYLVANGLMSAFKKIFVDGDGKATFSARMEYVLNYIILALLENENQTLLGINRMLFDKEYRKKIIANVTDPTVKDFWVNEYANYTEKTTQELAPGIQNKIGQFVSNPLIRNIIGQQKTSFNIRELMDNKKILIINLSKGKVGEGNANLLGSLLITKIYLAAMSRADIDPYEAEKLPPFYFYVDEFQNFANESFASILSEARKYKLALTVAHQYVEQMTDEVRSAVFGNVGTMIVFRIGATDAEVFEREFAPYFIMDDFVNLSAHQIYLRLMIDGVGSNPFSAKTLDPIQKPAHSYMQTVISHTRNEYAKPRFVVEEEIATFYLPIQKEEKKNVPVMSQSSPQAFTQSPRPERGEANTPYHKDVNYQPQPVREQRDLKIRKITNETPLPPRRIEPRRDDNRKRDSVRDDAYTKIRTIEEEFHKPPLVAHKQADAFSPLPHEKNRNSDEPLLKSMSVPTFDDKPAMSLKDALAKAMNEHHHEENKREERELKVRKEVDEDVLKKLLEEE
jgi:energy-coupling factor transporter ATP-binding protein EcfA2